MTTFVAPSRRLAACVGLACAMGLAPRPARAADPPHWSSASIPDATLNCSNGCHQLHQAAGGGLTAAASNVTLCQSCHNAAGLASALALNDADRAMPGMSGSSHAFGVSVLNPARAAQAPLDPQMSLRVMSGQVVCSTCHNQHAATAATGGTPRIGPARRITALGSTGAVSSGGGFTGARGYWYLVEIQTAGALGIARFRWSKDSGTSWMATGVLSSATPVALDNGVQVAFSAGNYAFGERWEFPASYPFLRAPLDSGDNVAGTKFCRDCHRERAVDHASVEVYDGNLKSHPVGVVLNANGREYDRSVPLDANGAVQGGAGRDANASNDLALDATGRVQCLTCHAPHHAPGNSAALAP